MSKPITENIIEESAIEILQSQGQLRIVYTCKPLWQKQ